MEDKSLEIHRGALLHSVAKLHKLSITKIATEAGFEQSSFYVHIKKADLPFEILFRYGVVLEHDFSNEIPEMMIFLEEKNLLPRKGKLTYDELEKQRDLYLAKYLKTLEDYNSLLKRLNP